MEKQDSICFVVTSPFAVNGFLINHLKELSRMYRVTLCVNEDEYPLSPRLTCLNLQIISVPLVRKICIKQDIKSWWILFKIFRNERFTAVHTITPKAGLLGISAAFIAKIPFRIHLFTGQVWALRNGIKRIFFKWIDRIIVKCATHVFADSSSQINFLIEEEICKKYEIDLLGPGSIAGIDLERFKPDPHVRSRLRKEFLVEDYVCVYLFVGRLCRDKGIFDLIESFSRLYQINPQAELWIIGPDEEGIKSQVKSLYPNTGCKIKWVGPTFAPENYMKAGDILLLPSYREGFGSVIIEAAACGLPTIAYRVNGVVDAIVDGHTGILVEPGSLEHLCKKMLQLLIDKDLRLKMGAAAKIRAIDKFSQENLTNSWLSFYKILFHKTKI